MSDVSSNGHAPADPAALNAALAAQIEQAASAWRARAEELARELEQVTDQLARYDKAVAALTSERKRPGPRPGTPGRPRRTRGKASRARGAGITEKSVSDERLQVVEEAIREITKTQDEFRQVDVRALTDLHSGVMATAFEVLRQEGRIRLARQDGGNKYFRLTREALQEVEAS